MTDTRFSRLDNYSIEQLQAMKDEAIRKAKAANMKDDALNAKAFQLQDVYSMKLQRERNAGRKVAYKAAR